MKTKLSRFLGLAGLVLLVFVSACRLDIFIDPQEGASDSGGGSGGGTSIPAEGPKTDGTTPASDALPPIGTVTILSTTSTDAFAGTGLVSIDILPLDTGGNPILNQGMVIQAEARNDGSAAALPLAVELPYVIHPGSSLVLPWAVVLDLDSSGSMSSTDPGRLRVDAAKAFVRTLLASRPNSQIAIADFGAGCTTGFTDTRWLADFTNASSALEAAIDRITASGATPLYESLDELLTKLHAEKPLSDFQPMLFVFSDGVPSTIAGKAGVYSRARDWGIPVHAASLGDASVKATMSDLAAQTGGIYADAADAAAIQASFNALVVAKDKGYLTLRVIYPAGSRAFQSSIITVTVRSGTKTGTATATLHL